MKQRIGNRCLPPLAVTIEVGFQGDREAWALINYAESRARRARQLEADAIVTLCARGRLRPTDLCNDPASGLG